MSLFHCSIGTVVRFLYILLLHALDHPMILALFCLAIAFLHAANIDIREPLRLLCHKLYNRLTATRFLRTRYGYNMAHGPHTWKPGGNILCQSPINIEDSAVQKLIIREMVNWNHYDELPIRMSLENTGCTLILRADFQGNRPTLSGADLLACYTFIEMRFRWGWSNSEGSEHTLNHKKFPLELQVMHCTGHSTANKSSYDLLMIGYIFELSAHNPYLDPITQNLNRVRVAGKKVEISPFPLSYLVYPFRTGFYSYGGSITEPPCYQGAEWFIFPEAIAINEFQLRQFRQLFNNDNQQTPIMRNSRPVQDLGSRVVSLNQFCPFNSCQMLVVTEPEDECEEETTLNTTTIITTTTINTLNCSDNKQNNIDNDIDNDNDDDENNNCQHCSNCISDNRNNNNNISNNNNNINDANNNLMEICTTDGENED